MGVSCGMTVSPVQQSPSGPRGRGRLLPSFEAVEDVPPALAKLWADELPLVWGLIANGRMAAEAAPSTAKINAAERISLVITRGIAFPSHCFYAEFPKVAFPVLEKNSAKTKESKQAFVG